MRHSTVSRLLLPLALTAFAVGCSLPDDIPPDDGGTTVADGGVPADGGVVPDGGVVTDGGTDGGVVEEHIAIAGYWDDSWGSSSTISDSVWGSTTIVSFDNASRTAITQNPADAQYNPSKFNKFVWTAPVNGEFWFCWLVYGKDSADAAQSATEVADATDPASSGCGDFSWTQMRLPIELKGTWDDNYGGTSAISTFAWGSTAIVKLDGTMRTAITQNPANAQYNPSKFNKFVWTTPVNGEFWFCWIVYGQDTIDDVENATDVADATNPASGGCGDFSWTKMRLPIEVKGTWDDNYGSTSLISTFKWGSTDIVKLNAVTRTAITQNPADAMYSPSKFNKFVWTEPVGGDFWFCWITYGQDTAEAAESATDVADATDPANGGCGSFSWSQMRSPIEVPGTWDDNYGGTTVIDSFAWGDTAIVKLNNATRTAITQNPADAMYSPSKFNKFVWTEPVNGEFWFCWITYGEDTAEAAENATDVADATDPANGGCGDFSWSLMRRPLSIRGGYNDDLGGTTIISTFKWATKDILKANEDARYVVVQNGAADLNPGKFGKIVWTAPTQSGFWYCPIATNEETAEAAETTTEVADPTDPENGGCNGFAWFHLTSVID